MNNEKFLNQLDHANTNHQGTFDQQNVQQLKSTDEGEIVRYSIGLDIAVAGFTSNPIVYEKYTSGILTEEDHRYSLGPDVAIGAPNVAKNSNQYDPAAAMFDYADLNHDGRIDKTEFGAFMKSV
ncbi:unnamed protein product [Adineta ricciae]|uniref:EF-hand domain-containing protein n=1 Tax=Adineta ricciae TaxID=249248 RepID=A0A815H3Z2_ADIRI|nr:unnamed protein product [Adineta ricciae]CAF1411212.1 unnamed protein product [Adineta ricciae]